MKCLIIVTDDEQIKEVSAAAHRQGVANAYAQFAYGSNGRSKNEAYALAQKAQAQQRREQKEYGE